MKITFLAFLFIVSSCTFLKKDYRSSTDLDQTYIGNGVEKYFLATGPAWANFSISGQCRRKTIVSYMNYEELKKSYAFDYRKLVNFQHILNKKIDDKIRNTTLQDLQPKDEAFIFYNVYEQIIGGGREFVIPDYNRISLLWIDPYINEPAKLKRILNLASFQKGFPILISDCFNSYEFEKYIFSHKLNEFGVKFMGSDMLGPYSSTGKLDYGYFINVEQYFTGKEVYFYGKEIPSSIRGIKKENFIKIK
jgi:hypothetical protein